MSLTFGQILDRVCEDGIDPSRRDRAAEWVRFRHSWLWGAAPWTFKQATGTVTFTANSQVAAAPTDMHSVYSVYDQQGEPLRGITDIRRFYDLYNTLNEPQIGSPEAYALVDGQLVVGPLGDGSTGLVVYQKQKPSLVNDSDSTGLPDGYDLALVCGAKSFGFKVTNAGALAAQFDAEFEAAVQALENDYLEETLEAGGQSGAYRPGLMWPAWRY